MVSSTVNQHYIIFWKVLMLQMNIRWKGIMRIFYIYILVKYMIQYLIMKVKSANGCSETQNQYFCCF